MSSKSVLDSATMEKSCGLPVTRDFTNAVDSGHTTQTLSVKNLAQNDTQATNEDAKGRGVEGATHHLAKPNALADSRKSSRNSIC